MFVVGVTLFQSNKNTYKATLCIYYKTYNIMENRLAL